MKSRKTNADFVPSRGEYNSARKFGKYVDTLGYKSIKQQIDSFSPQAGNFTDDYYDSVDDDPKDDPIYDMRDMELAEVGQMIAQTQKRLTSSAAQAQAIMDEVKGVSEKGSEEVSEN